MSNQAAWFMGQSQRSEASKLAAYSNPANRWDRRWANSENSLEQDIDD